MNDFEPDVMVDTIKQIVTEENKKNEFTRLGTVKEVAAEGVKVQLKTETIARDKYYQKNASYAAVVGDTVLMISVYNTYVIVCKIG